MTKAVSMARLRRVLLAGGLTAAIVVGGIADAGQRDAKTAARDAVRASKALAAHDAAGAVTLAEQAVSIDPRDPGYRLILGQSYLAAGRFASARDALRDAITLAPANGKIALNLALATIATGDWQAARQVLTSHRAMIQATDLGLATALAGDPASGVAILTAAVRAPDATVKTRQNLALALALSGRWDMARVVAASDLSAADVQARIEQWSIFAQPHAASDQVAALLGVKPIVDPGLPVALALTAPVAVAVPAVAPTPTETIVKPINSTPALAVAPAVVTPVVPSASATPIASTVVTPPASAAAPATTPVAGFSHVVFGPSSPVVQPLPIETIRPAAGPVRVLAAAPRQGPAAGRWFVQLGAFRSSASAQNAWGKFSRRAPRLARYDAHGVSISTKAGTLYRLSVGGFDRAGADRLCRRYHDAGGVCFVRAGAGDQLASWVNRRTQLASS